MHVRAVWRAVSGCGGRTDIVALTPTKRWPQGSRAALQTQSPHPPTRLSRVERDVAERARVEPPAVLRFRVSNPVGSHAHLRIFSGDGDSVALDLFRVFIDPLQKVLCFVELRGLFV